MKRAPSAKATTEMDLVNITLGNRQTRGFGCGLQCCLTVLGRAPDFTFIFGPAGGGIHWLHRGMVLVGVAVSRVDGFRRTLQGSVYIAILITDKYIVF